MAIPQGQNGRDNMTFSRRQPTKSVTYNVDRVLSYGRGLVRESVRDGERYWVSDYGGVRYGSRGTWTTLRFWSQGSTDSSPVYLYTI